MCTTESRMQRALDAVASLGNFMEIGQGGTVPISLPTGETRIFLEDAATSC